MAAFIGGRVKYASGAIVGDSPAFVARATATVETDVPHLGFVVDCVGLLRKWRNLNANVERERPARAIGATVSRT
jgi:hypothetical protein